jgi:choline-sulfatase
MNHRWSFPVPAVLAALSVLFVLPAGCRDRSRPTAPPETLLDLAADLDLAEIEREPGLVDVGTPAARPLLRRGWSHDETDGGRTFAWSDGPESEVNFFLAAPRDLPLILRGEPYQFPGAPAQEIALIVNGETPSWIPVKPGGGEMWVVLPGKDLRAGKNRLVLRYAWTRSPREVSSGQDGDPRRLAMAWDLFRFGTGVDESGRARAAGGRLALPFGWSVSSYLRLPAGAVLSLADLRARDSRRGKLRVVVQPEGGKEREVARLGPDDGAATVDLGETGTGPVRISLVAVPDRTRDAGGGLVLRRPLLAAPRQTAAKPVRSGTAAEVAPAMLRRQAPASRPRNVIVYLIDTLRADHLGCYGYGKPVSPRIDAFAREATLFRRAVAQSSWTRPAVATVLTGLLPRTHGVHRRRHALAPQAVTLAEMLLDHGWRTVGFVTNGNVARSFGFAQGFETYRLLPRKRSAATDVNAAVTEWLDGWDGKVPFFLYLHTVEPHAPYAPPPLFRQRFAAGVRDEGLTRMRVLKRLHEGTLQPTPELRRDLLALYDAEVAAGDAAFGELVDLLRRRGLWEETIIVLLSDHGEEFLEHGGWEHGRTLHAEMLDVPLIVRVPGVGNGAAVERQAQHADVVPTVVDALGLPIPAAVEGHSLLDWMHGRRAAREEGVEEEAFSWLDEYSVRAAAVTTPAWRLIATQAPISENALYDRRADPAEQRDVAPERPVRTGYLGSRLRDAERPRPGALRPGQGAMDAELRQRLQALGYVR